ncbi:uncharacterized protein DS421_20g689280 [Arachis hypogaea]|nr:uncharacterized protein DS421_20g689280 [Arachis hypogaea]
MLGSSSQSSGSSSRARSHGGWVKNAHCDRGGKVSISAVVGCILFFGGLGRIPIQKDHSMDALTIILPVRDGVAFLNGQMLKKKKP